jgi:hypothetical protein
MTIEVCVRARANKKHKQRARDLEKLGNLIQQANEKSSKVNLRGLFKSLKKSHTNIS